MNLPDMLTLVEARRILEREGHADAAVMVHNAIIATTGGNETS